MMSDKIRSYLQDLLFEELLHGISLATSFDKFDLPESARANSLVYDRELLDADSKSRDILRLLSHVVI